MAQVVSDSAVARPLGSVLNVTTTELEAVRQAACQTMTAVRGRGTSFAVLDVKVAVEGKKDNLSGAIPHANGRSRSRGWDPKVDDGVHPAVIDLLRELFLPCRAARKIPLTFAGASRNLRGKIPQVLIDSVKEVISRGAVDVSSGLDVSDEEVHPLWTR